MQTATSVLLFALVFSGSQGFTQAGSTTAPPSDIPNTHPPGTCNFNTSSGNCSFFPNNTDLCHQPIYPPDFIPQCDVLQKQWTYNSSTGLCVEFYYHSCKEKRRNYNVFASEWECTKSCLNPDACRKSIYPPGFIPRCMVVQKQWTYNQTIGQCVEFSYHPCGQDREGYDVFRTESECNQTCLQQDPCYNNAYPLDFKPCWTPHIQQWFYNPSSDICVEIGYQSCGQERVGYNVFSSRPECETNCVELGFCPGGFLMGSCFNDPCGNCPDYPNAWCEPNYCGDCRAVYFDKWGNNLTDYCNTSGGLCPDGSPMGTCFNDPCVECPAYPNAWCQPNYCGGCRAVYYDRRHNNLTDFCNTSGEYLPSTLPVQVMNVTTVPTQQADEDNDNGLSAGVISVIVVAAVLVLMIMTVVAIVVVVILKLRANRQIRQQELLNNTAYSKLSAVDDENSPE